MKVLKTTEKELYWNKEKSVGQIIEDIQTMESEGYRMREAFPPLLYEDGIELKMFKTSEMTEEEKAQFTRTGSIE